MKKITFLTLFLAVSLSYSQEIPVTFESDIIVGAKGAGGVVPLDANWYSDSGLSSVAVVADPETGGTNGQVGQMISSASGAVFQNAQLLLTTNYIDLTSNGVITLDVYAESPQDFLLKLEQPLSTGAIVQLGFSHTGTGWETIPVDFSVLGAASNGQYKLLVIFPGWDVGANDFKPAFNSTTYIDNISGVVGEAIVPPPAPTTAPAIPINAGNVYNIYSTDSDGSNLATTNYNGFAFGGTTIPSAVVFDGNEVSKYANVNFVGAGWDAVNFNTLEGPPTHIHIDYWATGISEFKFFLIDQGLGESFFDIKASADGIVLEEWKGMDIPLSAFSTPLTNVFQWKIDVQPGTTGDIYLDNIYLTDQPGVNLSTSEFSTSQFSISPNPAQDFWTVSSTQLIQSIQVYDILGKQVLTLQPELSEVVIDGSTLKSGIYLARISSSQGNKTMKLIKN